MRKILYALLVMSASGLVSGCAAGPRVVLVPPATWVNGTPTDLLKAGPDLAGKVYVYTDDGWTMSANEVHIPEGWIIAPPPPEKEEQ